MCAVNISVRCVTVYMYNIILFTRFILNSYFYDPLCPTNVMLLILA